MKEVDILDDMLSKKVHYSGQRMKIIDVLLSPGPDHHSRLWAMGFLCYVGFTVQEIVNIIENHSKWTDYNRSKTEYQVRWLNNHVCKG